MFITAEDVKIKSRQVANVETLRGEILCLRGGCIEQQQQQQHVKSPYGVQTLLEVVLAADDSAETEELSLMSP